MARDTRAKPCVAIINFSTRRIGGIRFVKLGSFCFSFCITHTYRPL